MRNWLKRLQIKGFVAGVLVAVLFSGTLLVAANTQTVTRNITYGIGVMLHGELINFSSDSRPFVMDGRTFMPLRALAELLDLPVDFDPAANRAILGRTYVRAGTPVDELFFDGSSSYTRMNMWAGTPAQRVELSDLATMGGNPFINPVVFSTSSQRGLFNSTQSAMLNLNGRYTWFNGSVGRVDGSTATINATVNIFVDERLVESFEQSAQALPREFRLFVEGARSVRVEIITSVDALQTMTYALAGFAE